MGLDMYLEKTERVLPENSEHSENQLLLLDLAKQWLSYTLDEETCTFEEYCGASEDILRKVGGLDAVKDAAELARPNLVILAEWVEETENGKKHVIFRSIWEEIDIGVKLTIFTNGLWFTFKVERIIVKNMKSQNPIFWT